MMPLASLMKGVRQSVYGQRFVRGTVFSPLLSSARSWAGMEQLNVTNESGAVGVRDWIRSWAFRLSRR